MKLLPEMQETRVLSLGQEDPLEEGMATHSSVLAWTVPWTMEPGGATVHEVTTSHTHIHNELQVQLKAVVKVKIPVHVGSAWTIITLWSL